VGDAIAHSPVGPPAFKRSGSIFPGPIESEYLGAVRTWIGLIAWLFAVFSRSRNMPMEVVLASLGGVVSEFPTVAAAAREGASEVPPSEAQLTSTKVSPKASSWTRGNPKLLL
jgi:hypothetical protein